MTRGTRPCHCRLRGLRSILGRGCGAVTAVLLASAAQAQDLHLNGMADLRLVAPSSQDSNLNGGLGKFRWGDNDATPVAPELGMLVLRGVAQLTPDLLVAADVRNDTQQRTPLDLLDAFVRWRPVSTTRWRWAVQAGAFFVPVSLENTEIGWTSYWTLTPSAINSWIGDELRTIGGQGTLEWRGDVDHLEASVAVFAWNQPAGVALADRGWTFNDNALGLFGRLRLPDVTAQEIGASSPLYASEFRQFDNTPGWYGSFAWERPDLGRVALLRYDNMADPSAHDATEFAWHTKFWSLGVSSRVGNVVLLAQGMVGSTEIAPSPRFVSVTDFWSGYVLAGYERGEWRYAVRFDEFGTSENNPGAGVRNSEHGVAVTTAVTWSPRPWLRLVGEVLAANYVRPQRTQAGLPSHAVETQAQLVLRLSF